MQSVLLESSLSKLLTILLIPSIGAIILSSYFNMPSEMINLSAVLLGIWYLIFVPRFLRIFYDNDSITLSMPLNPFYKRRIISLKGMAYLEIINFRGPFMKIGLFNGDTIIITFIPTKQESLQNLIQYLASKNIKFNNN